MVGEGASKLLLLFVGAFAAALALRFPLVTALVLLALVDFIFTGTSFAREIGPISVRPHELALALLLALAILRPKRRTWGGTPGIALVVFLVLVGVSDLFAIQRGATEFQEALSWARPLFLLTFFFVVIRLFPEPKEQRTLLLGGAVIGAVTGLIALGAAVSPGLQSALESTSPEAIREAGGEAGIDRVRLPGLAIGYGLFWYVATQVVARHGAARWGWALLLAGIATDIAVSFNRNMWVGVIAGLFLMAAFGGAHMRSRLLLGVATVTGAIVALVLLAGSAAESEVVEPVIERGSTIFNPEDTSREASVTERELETRFAWQTVQDKPLLGVGAGASYGMQVPQKVGSQSLIVGYVSVPQLYLHNQYLYLVLISGVFGLVAFVVFLGSPLLATVRRLPRDPAIVACGVGIAMIMMSAVVAIYFTVENMTLVLGLLTGVIVADREGRAADRLDSELLR